MTVTIMKKSKKFKDSGGNIPSGNFLGGSSPRGNFPGREFDGCRFSEWEFS